MRASVWLLLGVPFVALGACSPAGIDAPHPAHVAPIAPLRDWSSLALRRSDDGVRPKPGALGTSAGETKARKKSDPVAPRARSLYTRLSKDALLVVHIDDVSQLPDLFEASELGRLYRKSEPRDAAQQVRSLIEAGSADLRSRVAEFDALMEILPSLEGEAAISISGVTAEALRASPSARPWVVTVAYAAGDKADLIAKAAAPLLARFAAAREWTLVEKTEPAWGCEISDGTFVLDLEREGDVFEFRFGGRAAVGRELAAARKRAEGNSFYNSRLALDAASVEALGAQPLLEAHLQLTSLWEALHADGNRSDQRVLARTGMTQFFGASLELGRTAHGLAEALTLHSPAGIDLITHALTSQPLDLELARVLPAQLSNAGLYSFDGGRLIADLCLMIPSEAQGALMREISAFRLKAGIDIEKDLLGLFGPTIAVASNSWLEGLDSTGNFPAFLIACDLRDPDRAKRTLDALLLTCAESVREREQMLEGVRVRSLDFPLDGIGAQLDLHWCVVGGRLLASTRLDLISEALHGLRDQVVAHPGLRAALTRVDSNCFAVGFTGGESGTPDSTLFGRRTSAGLEWTAGDGNALRSTMLALLSAGLFSSLAGPSLLERRMDDNERAAKANLIVVADAQAMACKNAVLDEDGDGRGEFLFLPELCAAENLRGSDGPLSDPWLDNGFEWVAPGIGSEDGYRYRIDLGAVSGGSVCSVAGLASAKVAIDAAEKDFVVYAWPTDAGSGSQVFAFDSKTGLYCSNNRAADQHYLGERAPTAGAHWTEPRPASDARRHLGRDGGIWLRLRGP